MLELNNMGVFDPKTREEIAKQFEKIKSDLGIETDEEYQKELEELLGLSTEEMENEINQSLRSRTIKVEFVNEVIDGLLPPPGYFGMNVAMNKQGYEQFDVVLEKGLTALSLEDFENVIQDESVLILDARGDKDFHQGFIPGSINIGLGGDFAPWVGALIGDVKQPILLVTDLGLEEETVTRLTRVGFDNLIGHLENGFQAWADAGLVVDTINRITAEQFANEVKIGESKVIQTSL